MIEGKLGPIATPSNLDPAAIRAGLEAHVADLLADAGPAIRLSEHLEGDGALIFEHACRLGLEGVIAKRKGSA